MTTTDENNTGAGNWVNPNSPLVMDDSRIRNRKSRFFQKSKKIEI